jgi:hypothetical protein
MPDWFTAGVQIAQSVMLGICGFFLLDGVRTMRRANKIINEQQKLARELMAYIKFQRGLIVAMQAGVVSPWQLQPIDLRDLPIEVRITILMALIDIGVQLHVQQEEPS